MKCDVVVVFGWSAMGLISVADGFCAPLPSLSHWSIKNLLHRLRNTTNSLHSLQRKPPVFWIRSSRLGRSYMRCCLILPCWLRAPKYIVINVIRLLPRGCPLILVTRKSDQGLQCQRGVPVGNAWKHKRRSRLHQ